MFDLEELYERVAALLERQRRLDELELMYDLAPRVWPLAGRGSARVDQEAWDGAADWLEAILEDLEGVIGDRLRTVESEALKKWEASCRPPEAPQVSARPKKRRRHA